MAKSGEDFISAVGIRHKADERKPIDPLELVAIRGAQKAEMRRLEAREEDEEDPNTGGANSSTGKSYMAKCYAYMTILGCLPEVNEKSKA
jgi:hypothetical protein